MTSAVKVVCSKGHVVADVCPFPASGPATHIELVRRAARYRTDVARLVVGAAPAEQAWVTLPRAPMRITLDDFSAARWSTSLTWACRCGLQTMTPAPVISAAWSWSAERKMSAVPPRPRVVPLQRLDSVG